MVWFFLMVVLTADMRIDATLSNAFKTSQECEASRHPIVMFKRTHPEVLILSECIKVPKETVDSQKETL